MEPSSLHRGSEPKFVHVKRGSYSALGQPPTTCKLGVREIGRSERVKGALERMGMSLEVP